MENSNLGVSHDPRDRLVREKYFSLRPKPLERYLWQQGLPQAAERVFWLHWEEGMRSGDWCSEIPLKRVAALCCVDPSTVTRAYQVLKGLGLLRRESAGRDADNPFQQATAITEVRLPRDLVTELSRSPNRNSVSRIKSPQEAAGPSRAPPGPPHAQTSPAASQEPVASAATATAARPMSRAEAQGVWSRVSQAERGRFFEASRTGSTAIEFDPQTRLTPEDRGLLLAQLEQMGRAHHVQSKPVDAPRPAHPVRDYSRPRKLSTLELARTRKRLQDTVASPEVTEVLRQVIWAVEEGALRRFELPLAVNIAVKKIREGAWTRPNRMPPNWARFAAVPETCSAA